MLFSAVKATNLMSTFLPCEREKPVSTYFIPYDQTYLLLVEICNIERK